jgi:TusA-related sulfurtransferase
MKRLDTGKVASRWDAGVTGCGQLVVGMQREITALNDGESLELVARDEGAPLDVPSWCRMTDHLLLMANHPIYIIQKKGE